MRQLPLFPEQSTIDERFHDWLAANPHVLDVFRDAARRLRDKGHRRYSAKGIVEWMRFNRAITTTKVDEFKINNVFTSRLSRKLIEEDPAWGDFFETRKLTSREEEE